MPTKDKNYRNSSGRKTVSGIYDYVSLSEGDSTLKYVRTSTDFAAANGFVSDFGSNYRLNHSSGTDGIRTRGGSYGYVWYHYLEDDLGGEQRVVMTKDGVYAVHNVRDTFRIDFNDRIGNTTIVNAGTWSSNVNKLQYSVSSMDQAYGVAPQIRINKDYLLDSYLNDKNDTISTNSDTTIQSTTSSGKTFSVSTFTRKFKDDVKVEFTKAVKTSTGYTVSGKVSFDNNSKTDSDYIKIVVTPNKISSKATESKIHPINTNVRYAYVKVSELGADNTFSINFSSGQTTVGNFFVSAFYCSSNLASVWAIEDAKDIGNIATLKYDTVYLHLLNSDGSIKSTEPRNLFIGMQVELGEIKLDGNQRGYWFTDKNKAIDFVKNINNYKDKAPEGGMAGPTSVEYDGSIKHYYSIAGELSHDVQIADADSSYYFIYNGKNIYPSGAIAGAKIIDQISSASNTKFKLRIKYSYINEYYNSNDDTIKQPTINVIGSTTIEATVSNGTKVNFAGSTVVKEIEFDVSFNDAGNANTLKFEIIHPNGKKTIETNNYQIKFKPSDSDKQTAKFASATVGRTNYDKIEGSGNDGTVIPSIKHGTSVTANLAFNTGYYIPPTYSDTNTLGFKVPKMTFSYAGIVTDNNGYRYADGAYYPENDTTNAYAGELIRIDNSGAGINFDSKGNRKYYLSISGGNYAFDGVALEKQVDGSYYTTAEASDKVNFAYSVLLKPIYRVYVNGSETPIVIDSTNENVRFVESTKQYVLSEETGATALNTYAITVLDNNDLVSFTKADKNGNISQTDNEYMVSNIKISTFRDEIQSAEKNNQVINAKVEVDYVIYSAFNYQRTKEELEEGTSVGDTENTKATYNSDRLYDYGLTYTNNDNKAVTYTMSISSSDTQYYNPWVEYVNDVSIVVNGNQHNENNNFVAFKSNKGEGKTDNFSFS